MVNSLLTPSKPRDVQVFPIAKQTTVFRSRSWNRLRFEMEYGLQRGTTANSYWIQGDKTALIDPPGETFTGIYLESLLARVNVRQLDYLILAHINPNRMATLQALLEITHQVTIICSNPAAVALKAALPDYDLPISIVRGEETLDLGQGHALKFLPTPSPRWPDLLCTYDPKTQILFTDKWFGCHVCGDQVFDEGWSVFLEDRRFYYDCLMATQPRQVEAALERIAPLQVEFYAPNHGPMVRDGLRELTYLYQQWSQEQRVQSLKVALLYASAYGNTATLGQAIGRGITKAGVGVELINCESAEPSEVKTAIETCDGVIIGSPTLGGHVPTQIQTAFGILLSNASRGQTVGVFGSFGWSGEAIDLLADKLREAGFRFGFEPIRVKFKPTETTLQLCEESGIQFAQELKRTHKQRQPVLAKTTSQTGSAAQQALGRVIGSLCVVTAKQGEVSSALLTSWVAQATFNPPGFTVAIAKDQPIESLLHTGDPFVINILQEGKQIRKHFLKTFAPGEDRFAGLEVRVASNGAPILQDALAYLECQVVSRLDCGDHWVIYATTQQGQVIDTNGRTAVLHRKTGHPTQSV
ncbi:MAG: diflavin flavoprotein [Cyanobacteriota bacterium]|nr:diflavin flavoprotein [Cyanobacteriota bacterium]